MSSLPLLYAAGLSEHIKNDCAQQFHSALTKSVKRLFKYDGELEPKVATRLILSAFRDVYAPTDADAPRASPPTKSHGLKLKRKLDSDDESNTDREATKKSSKKVKKVSKTGEKKKGASGPFIHFQTDPVRKAQMQEEYQRLRVLPENKDRPEFSAFSKYCSMLWNSMSDEEKAPYKLKTQQNLIEAHEYNKSHGLLSKRMMREVPADAQETLEDEQEPAAPAAPIAAPAAPAAPVVAAPVVRPVVAPVAVAPVAVAPVAVAPAVPHSPLVATKPTTRAALKPVRLPVVSETFVPDSLENDTFTLPAPAAPAATTSAGGIIRKRAGSKKAAPVVTAAPTMPFETFADYD
jgi:hypothetical protein